jgi:hypothetical protein
MLRRALRLRDKGCRFPGCTNRLVDAHHVVHWAKGGSTTLANLCALCRRHHTFVHENGFRIEPDGGGNWKFVRPDGREVTTSGFRSASGAIRSKRCVHERRKTALRSTRRRTSAVGTDAPSTTASSCGR